MTGAICTALATHSETTSFCRKAAAFSIRLAKTPKPSQKMWRQFVDTTLLKLFHKLFLAQ
jgi:hypothetical protein